MFLHATMFGQGPKNFLCLWHVHKAWVKNVVKKIATTKDRTKVLSILG